MVFLKMIPNFFISFTFNIKVIYTFCLYFLFSESSGVFYWSICICDHWFLLHSVKGNIVNFYFLASCINKTYFSIVDSMGFVLNIDSRWIVL